MVAEGALNEDAVVNQLSKLAMKRLEGLDPQVRDRVKLLMEIQSRHDESESKLFEKMTALEFKYQNVYKPLYSRRCGIVNGTAEASAAGVPKLWLLAMKNNDILSNEITPRDEGALMFLKEIKWSRLLDEKNQPHSNKGFRLDFYFDPKTNPYFENCVLTKTYHMAYEASDYSEPLVEKAVGTEIKWREGKDLTKKKGEVVEDCESFFNFFNPPRIPVDYEELDEDGAYDLQTKMELDFALGCTIRDKIVPRAVSWFTAEAAVWGDHKDEENHDNEDEDGKDEEIIKESTESKIEDHKEDEDKGKNEENEDEDEKEDEENNKCSC